MTNDKGILIKNIYYMLTYAFQTLRRSDFDTVAAEKFENIHDLFAAILGKGVAYQLKQGLYKEYILQTEERTALRGKLNLQETMKNRIRQRQKLFCEYDELSENNLLNQSLKTTMLILLRHGNVKPQRKALLKKNLLLFENVDTVSIKQVRLEKLRYQRNNQNYRMLINICYLVADGLLLSTEKGEVKLAEFLDEQALHRLYEKFILEYYRYHHPEYRANPDVIPWNVDDGVTAHLPNMNTDITLKSGEKTLIIDAKYYAHTMQTVYDIEKIRSDHLYQIFAYVKNLDKENRLHYTLTTSKNLIKNFYAIKGGHACLARRLRSCSGNTACSATGSCLPPCGKSPAVSARQRRFPRTSSTCLAARLCPSLPRPSAFLSRTRPIRSTASSARGTSSRRTPTPTGANTT